MTACENDVVPFPFPVVAWSVIENPLMEEPFPDAIADWDAIGSNAIG